MDGSKDLKSNESIGSAENDSATKAKIDRLSTVAHPNGKSNLPSFLFFVCPYRT
jgi:hypothetical protein